MSVERPGPEAALVVRHTQQVIVRLAPGESVTLGRQFFWLTHGSRDAALAGVQAVYCRDYVRISPENREEFTGALRCAISVGTLC